MSVEARIDRIYPVVGGQLVLSEKDRWPVSHVTSRRHAGGTMTSGRGSLCHSWLADEYVRGRDTSTITVNR